MNFTIGVTAFNKVTRDSRKVIMEEATKSSASFKVTLLLSVEEEVGCRLTL